MDSALISDSVESKVLKKFIKENNIPKNRFFDSKTRSIIKLPFDNTPLGYWEKRSL